MAEQSSTFSIDWPARPKTRGTRLEGDVRFTHHSVDGHELGFAVQVMDFGSLPEAAGGDSGGLARLLAEAPLNDPDEFSSSTFPVRGGAGTEVVARQGDLFIRVRGYGMLPFGYAVIVTSYRREGIWSPQAEAFFSSFHIAR